jgi:hypothetical protein
MTFSIYSKEKKEHTDIVSAKDNIFGAEVVVTKKLFGVTISKYSYFHTFEKVEQLRENYSNNNKLGFQK